MPFFLHDPSFQSEGMTTLTNRSPRVYHCATLRTYLSQAHTCTSVHVPHFTTNNEVNRTKLSLSLSSPLSSDAIFITCHAQLYVPGAVYRRILEILKKAESSLIDYIIAITSYTPTQSSDVHAHSDFASTWRYNYLHCARVHELVNNI